MGCVVRSPGSMIRMWKGIYGGSVPHAQTHQLPKPQIQLYKYVYKRMPKPTIVQTIVDLTNAYTDDWLQV